MIRRLESVVDVAIGLDTASMASLRLAVIDPTAAHFPWTEELRSCRNPGALTRYWERRFLPLSEERLVLAVDSLRHSRLLAELRDQGVEVVAASTQSLQPFLLPPQSRPIHVGNSRPPKPGTERPKGVSGNR